MTRAAALLTAVTVTLSVTGAAMDGRRRPAEATAVANSSAVDRPARPAIRPSAHVRAAHRTAIRPAPPPAPAVTSGSVWDRLAECEAGGNWQENAGTIFDGGLQFHPGTWTAYAPDGYPAEAWQASREQQIAVAERVLADQGWGAWPACARKLGLR